MLPQAVLEKAAAEMLDSRWAGQVGRRASELAAMMRTGRFLPEQCEVLDV